MASNKPDDAEDPLRARFNALRLSPAPPSPPRAEPESSKLSPEDDLISRFRRLATPQRDDTELELEGKKHLEEADEDDVTEEKARKLDQDVDTAVKQGQDDVDNSKSLLDEAEKWLKEHKEQEAKEAEETPEDSKETEKGEDEEAEGDIISSALDEAELEKKQAGEDKSEESGNEEDENEEEDGDGGLGSLIELPSVPSAIPKAPPVIQSDDSDLAARLAALTGLKPKTSTRSSSEPQVPDVPDEEIESWCIICCDDATLKCIGCNGDLYCSDCWNEGHRGEGAGMEERRHKAVMYTKPTGKKKEKQQRGKIAA